MGTFKVIILFSCAVCGSSYDLSKASIRLLPSHEKVLSDLETFGIFNDLSLDCDIFKNENNCTSLDGFNDYALDGLLALKNESGCTIFVTGGFEKTGERKYKTDSFHTDVVDINKNSCIDNYIKSKFTIQDATSDYVHFISPSRDTYIEEANYWHIWFHPNLSSSANVAKFPATIFFYFVHLFFSIGRYLFSTYL